MNYIEIKTPGSNLINLDMIIKIIPYGTSTRFYYNPTVYEEYTVAYADVVAVINNKTVTG